MGTPSMPPPTDGPNPAGLSMGIDRLYGDAPAIVKADPYGEANRQRIFEVAKSIRKDCLDARWVFERVWWRNLLYVLGRQWIYYDRRRGQWVDKRLARWIPRPVTNKVAEGLEAIRAEFASIQLSLQCRPVGNSPENVATAEIADELEPFLADEHQMRRVTREQDFWLIVAGNAFLHPYWDPTATTGTVVVAYEQCQACGETSLPSEIVAAGHKCPQCGQPQLEPAIGEDGQPLTAMLTLGQGRTDLVTPLEVAVPPIYRDFYESPVLTRLRWRPKRHYEDRHPDAAKSMRFETQPHERSLQLIKALATQSDVSALPAAFGFGSGAASQQEGLTEYEVWQKPNKEFPRGLVVRLTGEGKEALMLPMAEDEEQVPGPLPYANTRGEPLWPWIHCSYEPIGGRLWSRSPVDLVIQKQDQINQSDSQMELITQRMANPIWLKPKGMEVNSFTGQPGLVVDYSPLGAAGINAKPEKIEGSQIQGSLFQRRQQLLDDFETLMGTFDVIKGAKPTGVEAFSALQLLVERGQKRFTTVFHERGEARRRWYELALELERQYGPDERTFAIIRPNRGYTFAHFERAKLQGAIEIRVEDGSEAPKTALGRRAAIEQANQLGLIDRNDPEQRYTILKSFGLQDLTPSLDFHIKRAITEQDAFQSWAESPEIQQQLPQLEQLLAIFQTQQAEWAQQAQFAASVGFAPPPAPQNPVPTPLSRKPYHRDEIHWTEHVKWANSDTAQALFQQGPVIEQLFLLHLTEHQQAMAPPPAPPPAQGGALAMRNSNRESGATDTVPGGAEEGSQNQGPR
jgi:hypothetical protein